MNFKNDINSQYSKDQQKIKELNAIRERKAKKRKDKKVKRRQEIKDSPCASKGELLIHKYLMAHNIEFIPEKEFKGMVSKRFKRPLRIDFYLPVYNIAIEFDGEQHFFKSKGFDSKTCTLKSRQANDEAKNEFCRLNNINLIRIPYTDINRITEILDEKLKP